MVPYTNSKSSLNVDTETIRIDARKSWSVTSKPNWITLSTLSGVKGVTDVIVTSSVNTSSSNRTGNIVIKDEAGKEYVLAVSQTASVNSVVSSRDAFNETYKSGSDTFSVGLNGNTSWSISSYEGLLKSSSKLIIQLKLMIMLCYVIYQRQWSYQDHLQSYLL